MHNGLKTSLLVLTLVAPVTFWSSAMAQTPADTCDQMAASQYDDTRPDGVDGVEIQAVNLPAAVKACRAAHEASPDNARTTFQYARVLGALGQKPEAIELYRQSAEAGHAVAMVNLGAELEGRDSKAAVGWYEKAASKGQLLGEFNLAVAYRDGMGVEIDGNKAAVLFAKAADKGDGLAAYNLAVLHDEGNIVPENNAEAIRFYGIAVDRGIVDAMINLATMLENGEGIEVDLARAVDLYQRAADRGDAQGLAAVERLK